jgi:hypothetical protein
VYPVQPDKLKRISSPPRELPGNAQPARIAWKNHLPWLTSFTLCIILQLMKFLMKYQVSLIVFLLLLGACFFVFGFKTTSPAS